MLFFLITTDFFLHNNPLVRVRDIFRFSCSALDATWILPGEEKHTTYYFNSVIICCCSFPQLHCCDSAFQVPYHAHFTARLVFTGFHKGMLQFAASYCLFWGGGDGEGGALTCISKGIQESFILPSIYLPLSWPVTKSLHVAACPQIWICMGRIILLLDAALERMHWREGAVWALCCVAEKINVDQAPLHSQAGIAQLLFAGMQKSCSSFFKTPTLYHLQDQNFDLKGGGWIQTNSMMKTKISLVAITCPNTLTTWTSLRESLLWTVNTHLQDISLDSR